MVHDRTRYLLTWAERQARDDATHQRRDDELYLRNALYRAAFDQEITDWLEVVALPTR